MESAHNLKNNIRAFTLIELVIVIAIIAILTSIIIPILRVSEYTKQSKDAKRMSDLLNIQTAITASVTNNEIKLTDTTNCNDCTSSTGSIATDGTGWVKFENTGGNGIKNYINNLPVDPKNKQESVYSYYSNGTDFELNAILKSEEYSKYNQLDGGNDDNIYEVGWNLYLN